MGKKETPHVKPNEPEETAPNRLEIDEKVAKDLAAARDQAIESYSKMIIALHESREEAVKQFDEEIKMYEELLKDLKGKG